MEGIVLRQVQGKDAKGNAFSGKEDGTEWYSIRNGKAAPS